MPLLPLGGGRALRLTTIDLGISAPSVVAAPANPVRLPGPLDRGEWRTPAAQGLPFLPFVGLMSRTRADVTICLGISAMGKLAGSVPGAQRRKTILNPVVVDPSICTVRRTVTEILRQIVATVRS